MNILVLEHELSSQRGGSERSLLDVCEGLAGRGHALTVACTSAGDLDTRFRRLGAELIPIGRYTVDRGQPWSAAMFLSSCAAARRTRFDVVYANQYMHSPLARVVATWARRPFVCHLRLPPPDRFCFQYRWGLRGAARLIAISRQTRADYAGRGFRADRIDVVYNGIDSAAIQPHHTRAETRARLGVPADAFLVAFAGRLHSGKGIDVLIDALARIAGPVEVAIAGPALHDGSPRDHEAELRQLARDRGLERRCHFLGHVAAIGDLFAAADVTALPSTIGEAFGRAIVESMACGTPVVASRIGGMPEVLSGEFAEWLVPAGDPAALAARLTAARGWQARDPGLSARCRRHVEQQFGLEPMVAGVERVLGRAVDVWRSGRAASAATVVQ